MAWFIAPYKRGTAYPGIPGSIRRYCIVRDLAVQIQADGGRWHAVEVLGNRAVVKVVGASVATLNAIAALPGVVRVPKDLLNDPLSTLSGAQRTAIRNQVLDAGYTTAEVNARFPNLANNTLGDVLRFLATRRLKPRYDQPTDTIVCDGDVQACGSIDALNEEVV